MGNFNLTNLAVNMFCPGNVAQMDDAGLPSLMVWIPAFRLCDVLNTTDESIHPAFIVNGVQIPGFWYSKYENVVHDGKAYSLPGEDPAVNVNFDTAREYCEGKGYGWHLGTAAEWAAIALWCKKNGHLPYGNNNFGKDTRETDYKAVPTSTNSDGTTNRVATGTGPLTWSHDLTMSGIWDLNGNAWEWQGGIRLVWGELQIIANNDAADCDNPQNETSACWKAINAADGSLVEPESMPSDAGVKTSGRTVKLDYVGSAWTFSTGVSNAIGSQTHPFANVTCTDKISDAAKLLLRALALLPDDGATTEDYNSDTISWINNVSECCVLCGGDRGFLTRSGVFCTYNGIRAAKNETLGFRASYIPNI